MKQSEVLWKEPDGLELQSTGSVELINPAQVQSVLFPSPIAPATTVANEANVDGRQDWAQVGLADGRTLRARLVVRIHVLSCLVQHHLLH